MSIPESIYEALDILSGRSYDEPDWLPTLNEIINQIQALLLSPEYLEPSTEKAELFYLLGYTYYQYPDKRHHPNLYANIERALLSAVEIIPNYSIAWLFLGHNAYDIGKYEDASERFLKCQESHFDSFYQIVLLEMKLCCSIQLEGLSAKLIEVEKFLKTLEGTEDSTGIYPYVLISILKNSNLKLESTEKDNIDSLLFRLENH
jgi:tetratricopeptide (TPR) repeat protein